MSEEPVIMLRDVSFSYGEAMVLEDVNLTIPARQTACMIGPNGGGKTTLVKLILGLLKPNRGEIRLFGLPPQAGRLRVGYMPQHLQYDLHFPLSVLDVTLLGRLGGGRWGWPNRADRRAALEALEWLGMKDFQRMPFGALSGGQRQRVLIARALSSHPDLLILDEPTSNVDTVAETRLLELLDELSHRMTILLVSHDLGFVSTIVKSVICVNRRVLVHPLSRLTPEAIEAVYGEQVRLVRHGELLTPGNNS